MKSLPSLIKIVLSILFGLCLLEMPYGFYQLVRLIALIGFVTLAIRAHESNRPTEVLIYLGLAVVFQPFFKIALGRTIWNIIDVVVGIGLITTVFIRPRPNRPKH